MVSEVAILMMRILAGNMTPESTLSSRASTVAGRVGGQMIDWATIERICMSDSAVLAIQRACATTQSQRADWSWKWVVGSAVEALLVFSKGPTISVNKG